MYKPHLSTVTQILGLKSGVWLIYETIYIGSKNRLPKGHLNTTLINKHETNWKPTIVLLPLCESVASKGATFIFRFKPCSFSPIVLWNDWYHLFKPRRDLYSSTKSKAKDLFWRSHEGLTILSLFVTFTTLLIHEVFEQVFTQWMALKYLVMMTSLMTLYEFHSQ